MRRRSSGDSGLMADIRGMAGAAAGPRMDDPQKSDSQGLSDLRTSLNEPSLREDPPFSIKQEFRSCARPYRRKLSSYQSRARRSSGERNAKRDQ